MSYAQGPPTNNNNNWSQNGAPARDFNPRYNPNVTESDLSNRGIYNQNVGQLNTKYNDDSDLSDSDYDDIDDLREEYSAPNSNYYTGRKTYDPKYYTGTKAEAKRLAAN